MARRAQKTLQVCALLFVKAYSQCLHYSDGQFVVYEFLQLGKRGGHFGMLTGSSSITASLAFARDAHLSTVYDG